MSIDMQKTGFAQIPIEEYSQLRQEAGMYRNLQAKVDREEAERKSLLDGLIKFRGQRDEMRAGERIILEFDSCSLIKYLELDKKIKQDLNSNPMNKGITRITDIHIYMVDDPTRKEDILREVNR